MPSESQTPESEPCRILCPFCGAPWSDTNLRFYDLDCADECSSGRFGPETATVQIVCHACDRLMYEKEGQELR